METDRLSGSASTQHSARRTSFGQTRTATTQPDTMGLQTRFVEPVGRIWRMDEAHIERTRRFDALFRAHSRDIIAYCRWRSDASSEADDAVAEVFLTAWRRLDDVPDDNAARVWLYATARRVIANQRRSKRRHLALRERLARESTDVAVEMFPSGSTIGSFTRLCDASGRPTGRSCSSPSGSA